MKVVGRASFVRLTNARRRFDVLATLLDPTNTNGNGGWVTGGITACQPKLPATGISPLTGHSSDLPVTGKP